jgi:hypothetical protein
MLCIMTCNVSHYQWLTTKDCKPVYGASLKISNVPTLLRLYPA